ncbi:MAG: LamG domain-containing protein, partial [Gammaproteobacteria bacterium]|nr:LamG domain-containing protein [Gammaproteobacteria bacterium]
TALEAGDSLFGGGSASGRRAQLPWGGDNFDVNHLNDDGLTILQRAIEWGAGAGGGGGFYLDEFPDFSCDGADEYRGSKGSIDWSGVAWVESGDDGRACGANLRVVDDPLVPDPTGNRLRLQNDDRAVERQVDLSSFAVANLSFDYRRDDLSGGAALVVEVSADGGSNWTTLDTIGASTDTAYLSASYDISTYMAADTMIRFSSNSSFSGEAYIDNVRIDQTVGVAGPIAHWKLDETSGTTAVDSVGGNDGTLINWPASPDWVPGKLNGGLSFDGNNDYIDVSSMNPMSYDDLTIVAWYKSTDTSVSDDEYIFEHTDNWVEEISFGPSDDGGETLRFGFTVGGSWLPHYGTSDVVDQQWHHLVAVRANGRVKLYVDGVKETDEVDNHAGTTVTIDGQGPFIGDYPGQSEQVHGILDDLRFYDRGLTDTEIADLFAEGGGGGSLDIKVAEGDDDAEQLSSDGTMSLTSTDLELADNLAASGQPSDIVGIRFINVNVPQGEIINNAYIQFQVDELDSGAASLTIEAEAVDDAAQFTTANYDITSRPRTTASVLWTPPVWTTVGERGPDQRTVDMSPVIQEIVNRPGWSSGNSIVIIISGGGTRTAEAYEGDPVGAPELHIDYGGGGGGGPPTIFEVPITTGSDDAEERVSNGNVNNNSSDLELSTDGSNNQLVGMRFTSVTIPNGSTISSAYIQFQVDETNSGATSVNIRGQAIDDAPTFTTGNSNISSRSRTSATVPWALVPWTTVGEAGSDQQTPNIATVIQEIIDRPGWASGNDLVIIITGSGERTAESYNGDSSGAALLHIEY